MSRNTRVGLCVAASIVLVGGCGSTQEASLSPLPTAAAEATDSAESPSPSASEESSPAPSPSPTEAAPKTVDVSVPVAFSITVPGEWERDDQITSSETSAFRAGIDRWLTFTSLGPDTIEDWVSLASRNPAISATDPEPVDLGGATGVSVDLRLNEGEQEVPLLREGWGEWTVSAGRPNRLWIVEAGGEVVLILTDAPESAFDAWIGTVSEVLRTIDWSQ